MNKIISMCFVAIICLVLSVVMIDPNGLSWSSDQSLVLQIKKSLKLDINTASARETREERRERLRLEKKQRRLYKENGGKFPEPEPEPEPTKTVVKKHDPKDGPEDFSRDMTEFLGLSQEEITPVPEKTKEELEAEAEALRLEEERKKAEEAEKPRERVRRDRRKKRERKPQRRGSDDTDSTQQVMSNEVYTKIEEAQKLAGEEKFDQALLILDELSNLKGRKAINSYEKANVWNFYGFIAYSKKEYGKAIDAYRKVLEQPAVTPAMVDKTQYQIAQLYMVQEDYPSAIKEFEKWFASAEKPTPDSYFNLAQTYMQVKNWDKALQNIKNTIKAASLQKRPPRENWYQALLSIYNELEKPKQQNKVVDVLLKYWPKKQYWLLLANTHGQLGNTEKQLEILNILYAQNTLEEGSQIIALAQMLAAAGVPYKAAKVMERGFKQKKIKADNMNLERTGEYWRQAYEMKKAMPLLVQASKNAPDGQSSQRLAFIFYNLGRYEECVASAKRAIAKGGLNDVNGVRMLMGQALFNIEKIDQAASVFRQVYASASDENTRITAEQWMSFMDREKQRIQDIKTYLKS